MSRIPVTALALAAAVLWLSACASAPPQVVAQADTAATGAAPATEQVCSKELPTGMRIPITVCRSVQSIEQRSAEDRDWASRLPTGVEDVARGGR